MFFMRRDIGPVAGEHVFFFGHQSMKPKDKNELRRMDPERDPIVGATYAIRISDEDAVTWARLFDLAMVVEVLDPGHNNNFTIRHYRVQYFQCRGVRPNCVPGDEDFRSEEVQLNMPWELTTWEDVHPWTVLICEQWVMGNEHLYGPWRSTLRHELKRMHEDLSGAH